MSSIERELCGTVRAICLSQDECGSLTQECAVLKKTIGDLLTEKNKMELNLKRARDEAERSEKMFKVYREKISKHEARMKEVESTSPLYKEMESLESSIQSLKDQRESTHTHTHTHTGMHHTEHTICTIETSFLVVIS